MELDRRVLASFVRAARLPAHGMIALPLLWGQSIALMVTGRFAWEWFATIHLFGVLCQVYILYLNDVADEAIDRDTSGTWLSGGSRVIPEGRLSARQLFHAAFVALAGMVLVALVCAGFDRPWMLLLCALAAAAGWTYSLAPLRSSYRGTGDLHQALSCGVLLPLLAFYLQCGSLASFPWLLLLPLCLVFFAGGIVTALPDIEADRRGGKHTFPVRYGERRATRVAALLLLLAYLLALVLGLSWVPWQWMVGLVSGPALILLSLAIPADHLKFASIATASQAWMLTAWTGVLFWKGLPKG